MRSIVLLSGFAALASTQSLPVDKFSSLQPGTLKGPTLGVGASSESFPYDSKSAYQSAYNGAMTSGSTSKRSIFDKRTGDAPCSPQPLGAGPTISPDDANTFVSSSVLSQSALNAITPSAYVQVFKDLKASVESPAGYLGYDSVSAYDPSICSGNCDTLSGCIAFNLFYERDPTLNPDANCTNPPSTTVIKCAYYGVTLGPEMATNSGQTRNSFQIVIAGSNGYVMHKPPSTITGYSGTFLGPNAINAPTECASYIGVKVWNDGAPFDPARCAAWCDGTSQYNIQYLNSSAICRFFDTYIWENDGVSQGQVCAMYTRSWDSSYATNDGQYDDSGSHYTVSMSYAFFNTTDPGAQICDATCMSQSPCPVVNSTSTATTTTASTSSSTMSSATSTSTISFTLSSTISSTASASKATTTTTRSSSTSTLSTTTRTTTTGTSKAVTTTTISAKLSTTTLQTSTTTKATSSTATPTKSACFKIKVSGSSYLSGSYITIDTSGKLAVSTTGTPAVFSINTLNLLICTSNGKSVLRTIESLLNPFYGYLSTGGLYPIVCTKGNDGTLQLTGIFSATSLWSSISDKGVMHGNQPSSSWASSSFTFEYADCPAKYPSSAQPLGGWGW